MYAVYECERAEDVRYVRKLVNYAQVNLDYRNKEVMFLRLEEIHELDNYIRLPQLWNAKVGYPNGWVFCPESSILTLLAHRLVWKVGQENPFSNGFFLTYISQRVLQTGAAWLRQAYNQLSLWWLPSFVLRSLRYGDPGWVRALDSILGGESNRFDFLLLMSKVDEIIPYEGQSAASIRAPGLSCWC